MKYGIREICDVVLKAKSKMVVGNKVFYKDEPVIYFDSLKTSTMEGAATTVYAQGGRGNSRLVAWEGERTVTFTMEDALISTVGLAILTGADVIQDSDKVAPVHVTEKIEYDSTNGWVITKAPYINGNEHLIYGMILDNAGNPATEPYILTQEKTITDNGVTKYKLMLASHAVDGVTGYTAVLPAGGVMLVDYYYNAGNITQIEITPDKFGGNFYLEASTLFRDTNGVDLPAEFIIPNCKVQSNFTFTMASSGDPSTFTFTMDAFPDYTRFNRTKKVLSVIQIVEDDDADNYQRISTDASEDHIQHKDVVTEKTAVATAGRIWGPANPGTASQTTYYASVEPEDAAYKFAVTGSSTGKTSMAENGNLLCDGELENTELTITLYNSKGTELDSAVVRTKNDSTTP